MPLRSRPLRLAALVPVLVGSGAHAELEAEGPRLSLAWREQRASRVCPCAIGSAREPESQGFTALPATDGPGAAEAPAESSGR